MDGGAGVLAGTVLGAGGVLAGCVLGAGGRLGGAVRVTGGAVSVALGGAVSDADGLDVTTLPGTGGTAEAAAEAACRGLAGIVAVTAASRRGRAGAAGATNTTRWPGARAGRTAAGGGGAVIVTGGMVTVDTAAGRGRSSAHPTAVPVVSASAAASAIHDRDVCPGRNRRRRWPVTLSAP